MLEGQQVLRLGLRATLRAIILIKVCEHPVYDRLRIAKLSSGPENVLYRREDAPHAEKVEHDYRQRARELPGVAEQIERHEESAPHGDKLESVYWQLARKTCIRLRPRYTRKGHRETLKISFLVSKKL